MSFEACKWVYRSKVHDLSRAIAWDMAFAADSKTHEITISVPRLAEKIGISRRQVQRELRALETAAVLVKVANVNGGMKPCTYRICAPVDPIYLEISEDGSDATAAAAGARLDGKGDQSAGNVTGDTQSPGGATNSHPLPAAGGDTQSPLGGDYQSPGGRLADAGGATNSHPILTESKKESPLPPLGGVREQDSGDRVSEQANASRSETFIALWSNFPGHEVMDRERAAEVFAALAEPDRQWARFAAIDYGKRLEALKRRPVDAHKWLERRGFEEFPDAKKLIPKPKRFAAEDSAAWKAWWVYCAMVGVPTPVVQFLPEGRGGTFPAEVPPCGLGYAAYADVPTATWPIAEPETPHWFAWSKRVHDWCGRWPEPELIMLDGTVTHTDGSGKTFETQRRTKGRRYPREWPLNKAEAQLSGQTDGDGA